MTYQIVKAPSLDKLEYEINARITEGWEPQGNIFVSGIITQIYHQAMVKMDAQPPVPGPTQFKSKSKN